jgi:pyruvate dehydrogenase E2 component (dihydrolipoamide acetyltransferase)
MPIEFKLPEVSEGVTSVDVADIRVKEGDVIEAGAVICEVETDKAVAEIPCPHAGRIEQLLIKTGDSVSVGQPLLVMETSSAAVARPAPPAAPPQQPAPAATPARSAPAVATPVPSPSAPPAPEPSVSGGVIEFRLPEVSEGVAKVDVASVAVKVGEAITSGTVICEVETDKAVAEIPCPHAGTITAIHVQAGSSASVGDLLVTLTGAAAPTAAPQTASPQPPAPAAPTSAMKAPPVAPTAVPTTRTPATTVTSSVPRSAPAPAGPATRRLARKLGVDLYQVKGSARGGRITIEDVEAWVRDRLAQPSVPAAAAAPGFGMVQAAPLPDFSKFGPVDKQPMNKIFRTAAANLHAAWVTIPHVTQHDLADITELESARKRYVKANPHAPKITMTAIMIKAVVGALKAYPNFNSSVDLAAGELILKQYYHIGVAVDTPTGLVVPVIRNCDQKTILQVASELTDLATRARDRKLKTEEMQGGTFTITNLGGIGGTGFTPIVNYPEVAILGMSRGLQQLVMQDGVVSERLMLPLSLSYDHRAVNGADAARFIVKLSGSLTNFLELF